MMSLERERAQVKAGRETEKLSVSGQVIENGATFIPVSNKRDRNRDTAESRSGAIDKSHTESAHTSSMQ